MKALTAADIAAIGEKSHRCGWTGGPVKNAHPECGCMCGTTYDLPSGEPIISRYGRNGPKCKHADERGRLTYQKGTYPMSDTTNTALAEYGTGWRAPDTAPKDGSRFIGQIGSLVFTTWWQQYYDKWPHHEGGPTYKGGWSYDRGDALMPQLKLGGWMRAALALLGPNGEHWQ